nr:hypothetical protein CFP56_29326 [Quercus suber]
MVSPATQDFARGKHLAASNVSLKTSQKQFFFSTFKAFPEVFCWEVLATPTSKTAAMLKSLLSLAVQDVTSHTPQRKILCMEEFVDHSLSYSVMQQESLMPAEPLRSPLIRR